MEKHNVSQTDAPVRKNKGKKKLFIQYMRTCIDVYKMQRVL